MKDKIVESVVSKYETRSAVGVLKYGTTLETNNKDNYLKHLQEELMDATLYIEKLISMNREITKLVKNHPNDADLGALIRELVR
jgi:hypothetical protein